MAIVTLPSGLSGEIRSLKGKELKLLTDQVAVKRGLYVDQILDACWVATHDHGPYPESEKLNWANVLVGDRSAALVQFRAATFGNDYSFRTSCESCGHVIQITLDLLTEIPVKSMSEEDKEAFRNGNKFTTTMGERKVTFRLPIGLDEQRAARGSVDGAYMAALNSRILEIEGVSPAEKLRFIENMDLGPLLDLQASLDKHDCGLDTDLKGVECDSCGAEQESVKIPFGAAFLAPKKR